MWRKHLVGICFSLLILFGCIFFFPFKPHIPDKELIGNFYKHQADFEKLAQMANEDTGIRWVDERYVGYKTWQDENQKNLSDQRWNEYKQLFNQLEIAHITHLSKEGDIVQFGSASIAVSNDHPLLIDSSESIVITKGYAFSLEEPSPLVDSLDEMGFDNQKTYYKRISGNWYLYHDWGVSKPE